MDKRYTVIAEWTYVYIRPTTYSGHVKVVKRGDRFQGTPITHGSRAWVRWVGEGYVRSGCVRAL